MDWNHRVVRRRYKSGEVSLAVYEVYYEDGKVVSCTDVPVEPLAMSEADEDAPTIDDLREDFERQMRALDKPILEWDEIGTVE